MVAVSGLAMAAQATIESPLQGAWMLVASDRILSDGEQMRDCDDNPKGRLIVDSEGRYSP